MERIEDKELIEILIKWFMWAPDGIFKRRTYRELAELIVSFVNEKRSKNENHRL